MMAQPLLGRHALVKGEPAEDVQVVLPLRGISPQGAADEGVDAVRADQDVGLDDLAVGHVQPHARVVLVEAVHGAVDLQDARRQRGEQPFVQFGAEQADEPAAVSLHNLVGQVDPHPGPASGGAELRVAGRAEVVDVHAEQAERLDRRGPQVEDVAGRACLVIPLEQDDVVAGLVDRQGGGHSGRAGADDRDTASFGGVALIGSPR